jgi:hypothetical protein
VDVTTLRDFKKQVLALKPSLAGEGWGEETLNNSLLPIFFRVKITRKKKYFNISSPNPLGNCSSTTAPALFYLRASCPSALLYLHTSL